MALNWNGTTSLPIHSGFMPFCSRQNKITKKKKKMSKEMEKKKEKYNSVYRKVWSMYVFHGDNQISVE